MWRFFLKCDLLIFGKSIANYMIYASNCKYIVCSFGINSIDMIALFSSFSCQRPTPSTSEALRKDGITTAAEANPVNDSPVFPWMIATRLICFVALSSLKKRHIYNGWCLPRSKTSQGWDCQRTWSETRDLRIRVMFLGSPLAQVESPSTLHPKFPFPTGRSWRGGRCGDQPSNSRNYCGSSRNMAGVQSWLKGL